MGSSASEQEVTFLKKITTVEPQRGTDFINITVKLNPQEEAALLANAIAQVGVERARWIHENRAKRALKALDEELDHQTKLVADHRDDLKTLLESYNLKFPSEDQPFPPSSSLPLANDPDTVATSLQQHTYNRARDAYTQSCAMLREMKIKQEESRTRLDKPHQPITISQPAE